MIQQHFQIKKYKDELKEYRKDKEGNFYLIKYKNWSIKYCLWFNEFCIHGWIYEFRAVGGAIVKGTDSVKYPFVIFTSSGGTRMQEEYN